MGKKQKLMLPAESDTQIFDFIREIKSEGIYLMLNKTKDQIKFFCDEDPREEIIERIQDNEDAVMAYLVKYGYQDA